MVGFSDFAGGDPAMQGEDMVAAKAEEYGVDPNDLLDILDSGEPQGDNDYEMVDSLYQEAESRGDRKMMMLLRGLKGGPPYGEKKKKGGGDFSRMLQN